MVRPRRFELLTYSFGGCRSIQLSYGRILIPVELRSNFQTLSIPAVFARIFIGI